MMKRTLVVAAISTLAAGAALAQSSITVYGRLNASMEYQDNIGTDGKQAVLQNNASRLGFKGSEDMGGGLKAIFLFEHRFNVDTGTVTNSDLSSPFSGFWAGDSFVGLESASLGTFRMGRMTSAAYYATADYISFHNHDTGTSADALYTYLGRDKNTIAYLSPAFGGFTFEGSVSAGEGNGDDRKVWGLAANFDGGAFQAGAGYEQNEPGDSQFAIRGNYTMGSLTFGGYYQRSDVTDVRTFGINAGTRDAVRGSVMYTMGANEFHVNIGWADDWSNVSDSDAIQYTLAYNYNLSKRTKLFAFYTEVDNSSALGYGAFAPGLDPSSFAVGVRHNF
jgi:predicted porin